MASVSVPRSAPGTDCETRMLGALGMLCPASVPRQPGGAEVPLKKLLLVLYNSTSLHALGLLRQVLCSVAFAIEGGEWLRTSTDDPLQQPPPRGVKLKRAISSSIKEA
eukprot:8730395-Lingulodinium_polyedra.AAC.1